MKLQRALLDTLVFTVTKLNDGGIETPQGTTPPVVVLAVSLPVMVSGRDEEPTLRDFLCVRNPQSEGLLELVAGGGGRKPS